ncbi:hypothetical protein GYH30_051878 [Glycine max]|uniref:Uncharacterized protein n=2 Tax=Glycine subgen. Soja TaxID=1462606 RepID=K7MW82_SOYBN|nr:hypothetical protein GYH30_051878 [Glycine max]RZB46226.1 UDP-glycosyltransferase 83A1 [Glycine soja]
MPTMLEKLIEDIHLNGDNRISLIVADLCIGWALNFGAKFGIFALVYNLPKLIDDGIIDSDGVSLINNLMVVLYVTFGSFTHFDQNQFHELALGLDLTNRPFLWVNKLEYPNEFLGTKGNIVGWAPQQKVLSHPAIACFATHCGWNSIMEGLSNGVLLLCWPYFADQLYNKTHICDELKVGLGFEKDKNGLVSREEFKMKVDQFFNDENIKSSAHFLNYLVHHCTPALSLTEWWLSNTAYELEPWMLTLSPKLLPIGPLLRSYDNTNATTLRSLGQFWEEDLSCMSWLDQQPHCSNTYVAFGHKGKIIGWAPQQKVLSHPAVACFISHCGWNSSTECLSNGVPFLCWPYFGDQPYNRKYICYELNVGLGLNSNENGLVSRWEIKKKLNQLLSDENIKSRSLKLKEKVTSNTTNRGQSLENFNKFVKWLKE